MATDNDHTNAFRPRNLADLLSLKRRRPDLYIFAGGTQTLYNNTTKYPRIARTVASIRHLEELKRVHRTERYIEFGACVSLSEIAHIGGRSVPPVLVEAIRSIASAPIRSLASIGGNICARENRLTLFPVLSVLDARIELRSYRGSRWVPIARLIGSAGDIDIADTEVLTRIRIPLADWNYCIHRRLEKGPAPNRWSLSFCGLAHTERGVLTDLRCIFGSVGKLLVRNREIEAGLAGKKAPLLRRDINSACRSFTTYVEESVSESISPFQAAMAGKIFRWFLSSIDEYSIGA